MRKGRGPTRGWPGAPEVVQAGAGPAHEPHGGDLASEIGRLVEGWARGLEYSDKDDSCRRTAQESELRGEELVVPVEDSGNDDVDTSCLGKGPELDAARDFVNSGAGTEVRGKAPALCVVVEYKRDSPG
jgi:hypothetical protein